MKYNLILILLLILIVSSCSTSKISKQDLLKENETLKAKIEALKIADTSKAEAVIELSKMNVVYRGLKNPVRISFPNAVKIEAEGKGLTKVDDFGNYSIVPSSGITIDVTVKAKMIDGTEIIDVKKIRIKDIGRPKGTINGLGCYVSCELLLNKNQLYKAKIGAKIDDFLIFKFIVHEFKIKIKDLKTIKVEGNLITKKLSDLIETNLSIGDKIQIFDIKVSGAGMRMKPPSPIVIRIVE